MTRGAVVMGLSVLAGPSTLYACKALSVPHGGDTPVFVLEGKHAAVPCEGCHGTGKPEAQSRLCIDCHSDALPNAQHYPGQECAPCHSPVGWEVVATPPPPTGDTGPTTTDTGQPPGWVHEPVGPLELCWDCHDTERPADHYWNNDITFRWDCGPCHTLATWNDDPRTVELDTVTTYEHPARTPHGTRNGFNPTSQVDWVVACTTCHPAGVLTQFDCVNCHLQRNSGFFPHYNASNEDCIGCHVDGDFVLIDPP